MKKLRFIAILCVLSLLLLTACGQGDEQNSEASAAAPPAAAGTPAEDTDAALPNADPNYDYDLTAMSATMVFSLVADMIFNPDIYVDKTFKMEGMFAQYELEDNSIIYAVIINDATGCCPQGIELKLPEGIAPEAADSTVLLTGVFDTGITNGFNYFFITVDSLQAA